MHRLGRMIAVLLALTMASALPGAHAVTIPATQTGHPAGCHSHGPASSSPAPTSYQCCVNGHHWTIPSVSFSFSERLVLAPFATLDGGEDLSLASTLSTHFSLNAVTASSPPGIAPLRI
jgi:hypothetical protein